MELTKYSQVSHKCSPLVQDKVVSCGKNRQNKLNAELTGELHKDFTLSAKITEQFSRKVQWSVPELSMCL